MFRITSWPPSVIPTDIPKYNYMIHNFLTLTFKTGDRIKILKNLKIKHPEKFFAAQDSIKKLTNLLVEGSSKIRKWNITCSTKNCSSSDVAICMSEINDSTTAMDVALTSERQKINLDFYK